MFTVWLLPSSIQPYSTRGPVQSIVGTAKGNRQDWGKEEKGKGGEKERRRRRKWGYGLRRPAPSSAAKDFERVRGEAKGPQSRPPSSYEQVSTYLIQSVTSKWHQIVKLFRSRGLMFVKSFCLPLHFCFSRFHSFLLFLGYSRAMVRDTKAEDFCKTISNFSLEYRTTRQAILLQREREQQKTGAESPGRNTPVVRRKRQQTPTQVVISVTFK